MLGTAAAQESYVVELELCLVTGRLVKLNADQVPGSPESKARAQCFLFIPDSQTLETLTLIHVAWNACSPHYVVHIDYLTKTHDGLSDRNTAPASICLGR